MTEVTRENYYSPELNMEYMGSTQFKAFQQCEAAALAQLKGEYAPPTTTALLVAAILMPTLPVKWICSEKNTRKFSSVTAP